MLSFLTPDKQLVNLKNTFKDKRQKLKLSRRVLGERSGVSAATIKHYENTGKIGIEALLRLAYAMDFLEDFSTVGKKSSETPTLDELRNAAAHQKGR